YLKQPDLTARRFIPNPLSTRGGERLYNAGHIARYLPDGSIELLKRVETRRSSSAFGGATEPERTPAEYRAVRAESEAPRTETEALLAEIWAQVFGLEQVGIHDDFLELGGYSLLAILIVARIREAFKIELPLNSIFQTPTVEGLAESIENLRGLIPGQMPPVEVAGRDSELPLSFVQEHLWQIE